MSPISARGSDLERIAGITSGLGIQLGDDRLGIGLQFLLAALAAEIERPAFGGDLERLFHRAEMMVAHRADGLLDRDGLFRGGKLLDRGQFFRGQLRGGCVQTGARPSAPRSSAGRRACRVPRPWGRPWWWGRGHLRRRDLLFRLTLGSRRCAGPRTRRGRAGIIAGVDFGFASSSPAQPITAPSIKAVQADRRITFIGCLSCRVRPIDRSVAATPADASTIRA